MVPVAYDRNGNILSLERQGHTNVGATTFGDMDKLAYAYDNGNRLLSVTDAVTTPALMKGEFKDGNKVGNDYGYDANGNMDPVGTAKGLGNTAIWAVAGSQFSSQIDEALGTNATAAGDALMNSLVEGGDNLINGNGIERGTVIGEIAGVFFGAKGRTAAIESISGLSNGLKVSSNVQKALNTLEDIKTNGGQINVNPTSATQELNLTVIQGAKKLDLRIETHPLPERFGGNGVTPQRHMNVDLYPKKNSALPNKGHKILDEK